MPSNGPETCLTGVKVLDLTQFEAGPSCTEALAWMGADVVKVENPRLGDPGRTAGGKPGQDANYFLQYNANKRSVTVNLKDPRGVELVKEMAKKADIFCENFAPGAIERLGLGPDVIRALNPSIIYCQTKGFGAGSPFEKNLAFDMIAQAAGGLMSITGEEDGPPCKPGATIGDTGTGMLMAISVLGAYVRRLRTGQGEHLQLAMQDAILHYIRNCVHLHGAHRQAGAARRIEDRGRRQSADRRLSVQGRRAERLRLHLLQPRQPRALESPAEGDGPRGPDRRPDVRYAGRAHPAPRRGGRDRRELDTQHDKHEAMRLVERCDHSVRCRHGYDGAGKR